LRQLKENGVVLEQEYSTKQLEMELIINQLRKENRDKEQAIVNSKEAMADIRSEMNLWQKKIDGKKKQISEAKEMIKLRDIEIKQLKEEIAEMGNTSKHDLIKRNNNLITTLNSKDSEIANIKEQYKEVIKKLKEKNGLLEMQLKETLTISNKENSYYAEMMKLKAELHKLKKDRDLIYTDASKKIHTLQRIKTSELYKDSNKSKERMIKLHYTNQVESEDRMQELQNRVMQELNVLPELRQMYENEADPIEQIPKMVHKLVKTIAQMN